MFGKLILALLCVTPPPDGYIVFINGSRHKAVGFIRRPPAAPGLGPLPYRATIPWGNRTRELGWMSAIVFDKFDSDVLCVAEAVYGEPVLITPGQAWGIPRK